MEQMNRILNFFNNQVKYHKEAIDWKSKMLYQQKMRGFIIGLELSGKNIEANKCKEIYEQEVRKIT